MLARAILARGHKGRHIAGVAFDTVDRHQQFNSGARRDENTITDESNDVWIGAPSWANCGTAPKPCYNASIYLNNLLGAQTGVNNAETGSDVAVGAANNFWGCKKEPGASGCSKATGNVSTTPFLTKSVRFP